MLAFLAFASASGATLSVDAKLPTEIAVDGRKIAEIWEPARLDVEVAAGRHKVRVYRQGNPTDLDLEFAPDGVVKLVVGRTGITTENEARVAEAPEAGGPVKVELRAMQACQVRLDKQRYVLGDGDEKTLDLAPGTYAASMRNPAGTVIWARGQLVVEPGDRVVIQVSSGRVPEVSGAGRFDPGSK